MNKHNIKETEKNANPEQAAVELTDDELEQAAGGRHVPTCNKCGQKLSYCTCDK